MDHSVIEHLTPDPSATAALMGRRPAPGSGGRLHPGKLAGRVAVITGGDSGIGRAVAVAFAREGADVLISYYNEHEDAMETQRQVGEAGSKCLLMPGDLARPDHCRAIIRRALDELGQVDILVNNASFRTFQTQVTAMFHLCKAAVPHMRRGSAILNTTLVSHDRHQPRLVAHSASVGAMANFTGSLALLLADKGIRVNLIAQSHIGMPRLSCMLPHALMKQFGKHASIAIKRPDQPHDVDSAFVFLASDDASLLSGACYEVPDPMPMH